MVEFNICEFFRKNKELLESGDRRRFGYELIEKARDECLKSKRVSNITKIPIEAEEECTKEIGFGLVHELEHCPGGREKESPMKCIEGMDGLIILIKKLNECL